MFQINDKVVTHYESVVQYIGNSLVNTVRIFANLNVTLFLGLFLQIDVNLDINSDSAVIAEREKWFLIMNSFILRETAMFSARTETAFNELIARDPFVGPFLGSVTTSVQENTYNDTLYSGGNAIQLTTKSRSGQKVALSFLVWFVSNIIPYSEDARLLLNNRVAEGFNLPTTLIERLKCTRNSRAKSFAIRLLLNGFLPESYLESLGFKRTYLDVKWLCSQEGISALTSLFNDLSTQSSGYIHLSPYENKISVDANKTTTATAISLTGDGTAQILPGTAYPKGEYNGVHVADVFRNGARLLTTSMSVLNLDGFSDQVVSFNSSSENINYVISRVTGTILNGPKEEGLSYVPQSYVSSSSKKKNKKKEKVDKTASRAVPAGSDQKVSTPIVNKYLTRKGKFALVTRTTPYSALLRSHNALFNFVGSMFGDQYAKHTLA